MLLLDILPQESVFLRIHKPMVLWIGTHKAAHVARTIFSPVQVDIYSEICINGKHEVLCKNKGSSWFQARLYNVAINPERYLLHNQKNDLSILSRILPFQYCISQGALSVDSTKKAGQLKIGQTILIEQDEYQQLEVSADLLSTPYAPQEMQWLKQPDSR